MKKSLLYWQVIGFIFTGIIGVLLHFLFDYSNQNIFIATFSAVNESIWEHMKLLFFPMFIFALFQNHFGGKNYSNFWCVKLIGIIIGIILIPTLYYTINGIWGQTPDWVNIAIFFIVDIFVYILEFMMFNKNFKCNFSLMPLVFLWLIVFLFIIMTFFPLHIPLFQDPINSSYGYFKTNDRECFRHLHPNI